MDKDDAKVMAVVWIESLDRENIPYQHYEELYRRSVELRSQRMAQGLKCDDFSVDMMLACWPGLKEDLKQREIDRARLLPTNAESVCQLCFGTGFRSEMEGQYRVSRKCDHIK